DVQESNSCSVHEDGCLRWSSVCIVRISTEQAAMPVKECLGSRIDELASDNEDKQLSFTCSPGETRTRYVDQDGFVNTNSIIRLPMSPGPDTVQV
ncbi:hypothetical protein STEG23_002121, partial [Scotinomys teguina]